jgi:AcrR family transcriptional regulator
VSRVAPGRRGLMVRTGRQPGKTDTRGEILGAARAQFAASGYAGATIRGIAAAAGVDPALVHHYFGTKRDLFVAAVDLPFDPGAVVTAGLDGEPAKAGERIVRSILAVWETDAGSTQMQAVLRSALTDDRVLLMLRDFIFQTVLAPIAAEIAPDRPELRTALLASQVVGLAMVRYVIQVEPLASEDPETVVSAIAPTLQRYLTGDLEGV